MPDGKKPDGKRADKMKLPKAIAGILLAVAAFHAATLQAQSGTTYALLAKSPNGHYAAAAQKSKAGFLQSANAGTQYLRDSSLVMTAAYMNWHTGNCADGSFTLYSDSSNFLAIGGNDGEANMTNLTKHDLASKFTLADGKIATTYNGKTAYLVMRNESKTFCFVYASKYNEAYFTPARLYEMQKSGSITAGSLGAKTYKGHFNLKQISQAIDSTTTSVDLTEAVLPLHPIDFTYTGTSNCLIYMRSEDIQLAPATWRNVVAVNSGEAHLLRTMAISDAAPFHAPRAFTAGNDSLSYTRTFSRNGWSTLALPFTAEAVPEGTTVYTPQISGDTIITTETGEIASGKPYLVRFTENGDGSGGSTIVTFKAKAGTKVECNVAEWKAGEFACTFTKITPEASTLWLLADDGHTFAPAAADSWMAQFRCGFKLNDTALKGNARQQRAGIRIATDKNKGRK